MRNRERDAAAYELLGIRRRADSGAAPLSFAQRRLWFLHQLEPEATYHHLPILVRLSGPLDYRVLTRSLQEVIRRQQILRTAFSEGAGVPVQTVLPNVDLTLPKVDLTRLTAREQEMERHRWTQGLATRAFDLSRPPLFRVALLAFGPSHHDLFVVMHRIVCDGWSLNIFIRELGVVYRASMQCRPSPFLELPIQYADFAVWQLGLSERVREAQVDWWRECLAGAPPRLDIPTDRPRPPLQSFRGSSCSSRLEARLVESLRSLARHEGATLFMILLASWAALLSRHADQEDMLLGTPIAGRTHPKVEGLIGCFANILVLRADLRGEPSFHRLIERVRAVCLNAYAHQDLPFEKLVEELALERDLSRSPLFQTMLALQNFPGRRRWLSDLLATPLAVDRGETDCDLALVVEDGGGRPLCIALEYSTDLFDGSTALRILERFQALLQGVVADPMSRVSELPLLSGAERYQVTIAWNDTTPAPLAEPLLYRRFRNQAAKYPDAVALVQGERRLSYGELSRRAEQLAAYLFARGVGPEIIVGLRVERSIELVVAMLAILAAGGACLPIDLADPDDRQAWLLSHSGASLVIVSEAWPACPASVEVYVMSAVEDLPAMRRAEPVVDIDPECLAYVLYSSGSTGPKGVMVQNRALAGYLDWAIQAYEKAGRGAPVHSSLAFDMTTLSLWSPLLAGRAVTLLPEGNGVEALAGSIRPDADFSMVALTPAHLDMLARLVLPGSVAGWTRTLVLSGEMLWEESLALWRKEAPRTRIFKEYGPTETVGACSVYEASERFAGPGPLPIGQPTPGASLYVLDRNLNLAPIGVVGELSIGGERVTRGYRGDPGKTAERFQPDPFSIQPGARLFRSGDLARWRADGSLEYLGRNDRQIKLGGFRIEPQEIEVALKRCGAVRECVVVAREGNLTAYLVGENLPDAGELRAFLAQRLPEYMLPTAFVVIDAPPLTASGKVDRRALPPVGVRRTAEARAFEAPRTRTEEILASLWTEVLGVEHVSVQDRFFELGGDSMLAVRLASRMREVLGSFVSVETLFEAPTIAALARRLELAQEQRSLAQPDRAPSAPRDIHSSIETIYEEMQALVQRHEDRPGLRAALQPFRTRLQALLEIEALELVGHYDSHFTSDYEKAQELISQARKLLGE